MAWPTPQEYNEAIQNPALNFADADLRAGQPELTALGLPRAITGGFASVYRVQAGGREWAVRCFLREFADQRQRYAAISRHLARARLPYTIGFDYLPQGIRVRGQWYPILKMEWVRGDPLNVYVAQHLNDGAALRDLAARWAAMMADLRRADIAHGDLQHGNVLVVGGEPRLIDYDGMYVPALAGQASHEVGHRNYQHPARGEADFGPYLDHFAAWAIYLALLALGADPALGQHLDASAEHLLFRQDDFNDPAASGVFQALAGSADAALRALAATFATFPANSVAQVPPLDTALAPPAPVLRPAPVSPGAGGGWLVDHLPRPAPAAPAAAVALAAPGPGDALTWVPDHLRPAAPPRPSAPGAAERGLCAAVALVVLLVGLLALAGLVPALAGIEVAAATLALGTLTLAARYWSSPEMMGKVAAALRARRAAAAVREGEAALRHLRAARDRLDDAEARRRGALRARRRDCAEREKEALARLDRELAAFDLRRQALGQEEARELAAALATLQGQFVERELARHALAGAAIPGVGPRLKLRLLVAGVRTAASFADVRVTPTNGGHEAAITLDGGGSARVEGLGPQQARALLAWRDDLETRLRRAIPQSLPAGREAAIRARYAARRQALERQAAQAEQQADQRRDAIRQQHARERASLTRRARADRKAAVRARQEHDRAIAEATGRLAARQWALALARRDLAAYRQVGFAAYLRRLLAG